MEIISTLNKMFANLEEDYSEDTESEESDTAEKDRVEKDKDKDAPPKHLEAQVKIFTKCPIMVFFLTLCSKCSIAGPPLNWGRVCEPDQRF